MKKLFPAFAILLATAFLYCNAHAAGTITVGASPTPHAEILAEAAKLLQPQGYTGRHARRRGEALFRRGVLLY